MADNQQEDFDKLKNDLKCPLSGIEVLKWQTL